MTTPLTESDISRSAQTAWKAVFGQPLPVAAPPRRFTDGRTPLLVARVRILGTVPRTVMIVCPLEEARHLAARFFNQAPEALEPALVRDVFGELANMIGGQLKRHFPLASRLSLPEVSEGPADAGAGEGQQAVFEFGRRPMAVRVVPTPS